MKFVNKLSVVSLLVLMFSFVNIATADPVCPKNSVSECDDIKDAQTCKTTYQTKKGEYKYCSWLDKDTTYNTDQGFQMTIKAGCSGSGPYCKKDTYTNK